MDAPVTQRASKFMEGRLYKDMIYRNGKGIGKIESTSVLVYDDTSSDGTYF
jgi:hypothetical protein